MNQELVETVAKALFVYDFPSGFRWEDAITREYIEMAKIAIRTIQAERGGI